MFFFSYVSKLISTSLIFLKKKLTIVQWSGIGVIIAGLVTVGLVTTLSPDSNDSSHASGGQQVLGVILLISAMVFTGLHVRIQSN